MAVVSRRRSIRYIQQPLVGTANPRVFLAPAPFIHTAINMEAIYYNGLRQTAEKHYTVEESGGAGSGYDIIVLVADPARVADWTIDYSPASL